MAYKKKSDRQKYSAKWYKKNKQKVLKNNAKNKKERLVWFKEIKLGLKCEKCGESNPACLDFHHKKPNIDDVYIADLVSMGKSKESILKELGKCVVLCSNCHRKLHSKMPTKNKRKRDIRTNKNETDNNKILVSIPHDENNKDYHSEYIKKWYQKNKGKHKINAKKRRDRIRQEISNFIKDYKNSVGCSVCEEKYPACLEFHHKDPKSKKFNIALAGNNLNKQDAIENEIKKCIVLCSNCHRKLHHSEKFKI